MPLFPSLVPCIRVSVFPVAGMSEGIRKGNLGNGRSRNAGQADQGLNIRRKGKGEVYRREEGSMAGVFVS